MLDVSVMWVIGIVLTLLPFVLTLVFHGTNQSDARGRRISTRWRGKKLT